MTATFSQLPRLFACEASHVLPVADVETEDRAHGSARHLFLQRVTEWADPQKTGSATVQNILAAKEIALAQEEDTDRRAAFALIPVEEFGLEAVAAEVALAIDLETGEGRELGRGLDRKYPEVKDSEIIGTIDRLGFIGEDGLHIGDYKGRSHTAAPDKDPQFLTAALAACRAHHRTWAEIEVIRFIGNEARREKAKVDVVALDHHELELQKLADRRRDNLTQFYASGGVMIPPAKLGPYCSFCPSLRFCPAKYALARAALGGTDDEVMGVVKAGKAYITEANAGRLYSLVREGRKALDILDEALKDFGRQTTFPLADGKVYGVDPDATEREFVDGKKGVEALKEIFGEAALAAGKVELTWKGIDAATRAFRGTELARGDLKKYEEQAEALLEKRGLLRIIKGGKVGAFKPKGK